MICKLRFKVKLSARSGQSDSAANNTRHALPLNKLRFLCYACCYAKCRVRCYPAPALNATLMRTTMLTEMLRLMLPVQLRAVVRVNQRRDGVSPVVASMYCSPHLAALHIDPPPGSGCFAFRIPRPENCLTKMIYRRGRGIMAEHIYTPPPFRFTLPFVDFGPPIGEK